MGRAYPVRPGEVVLGNALQRRRRARFGAPGGGRALPGWRRGRRGSTARRGDWSSATSRALGARFVNRQRLLLGQSRALEPGDVIQLGGVQLKVVAGTPVIPASAPTSALKPAPPPTRAARARSSTKPRPDPARTSPAAPPTPGRLPAPFTLETGTVCRTWDDFLTVSAQRWAALRDELNTGRLAAFLAANRLGAMIPAADAPGTPDERLDAWLATLPTTRTAHPELDVHPETLAIRAVPGGGVTRQCVRIANTGYRLLRSTTWVEQATTSWIRLPPEFTRVPFVTVEETDMPVAVEVPEAVDAPLTASLVIEGNGGSRRVEGPDRTATHARCHP